MKTIRQRLVCFSLLAGLGLSRQELDDIAERFYFETGVVPVIIDS